MYSNYTVGLVTLYHTVTLPVTLVVAVTLFTVTMAQQQGTLTGVPWQHTITSVKQQAPAQSAGSNQDQHMGQV